VSRTLSANAVLALNALQTGNAFWFLVEVTHPDMPAPDRFVNNTTNVIALGQTWNAFPFDITLSVDDGQTQPSVEIRFDNVGRELVDEIRGLPTAPALNLYLVLSNTPDTVEMSLLDLRMVDITYDMQSVSARLVAGDLLNAPYPSDSYGPDQFPSIFR
jgi:hypothetical protein